MNVAMGDVMKFSTVLERIMSIINGNKVEQDLAALPTIGERLVYLRKKKKLSRKDLSPLIGIEYNVLHKYETNRYKPKADRVKMFAEFYDVPEEYITGESVDRLSVDDIYFIGNLRHFCWEVQMGLKTVDNREEMILAVLKADRIIVKSIDNYCNEVKDRTYLIYIYKIFSNNKDPRTNIDAETPEAIDQLLVNLIANYESDEEKIKLSLDYLSRIIECGACVLCALTKKEYDQVLEELKPVIKSYIDSALESED